MPTALLLAIKAIFFQMVTALLAKPVLEWMLFTTAEAIVESTKTVQDDKWYAKLKDSYYAAEKEGDGYGE